MSSETPSDTDPDDKSGEPTTVRDPESYINKRRLKGIFDIRDEMTEIRKKVKVAPHADSVSSYEALSAYRALVDSYDVETESLLRQYKGGLDLLQSRDFGTAQIAPRYQNKPEYWGGGKYEVYVADDPTINNSRIAVNQPPEPTVFELTGLLSVVSTPDPLVAEYELHRSGDRHGLGDNSVLYRCEGQISFRTLDTMVRALNNFLGKIGLEVDPEEESEPWDIEDAGL